MKSTRASDLGIRIGRYSPGKYNGITDVAGVRVGHVTLNSGKGKLICGKGPIHTGVTVILPAEGSLWQKKMIAGSFILNGNGEATGLMWIKESGILESPIALTNTHSVPSVCQGLLDYICKQNPKIGISDDTITPVVFECDDSTLSDIRGHHVKPEHVIQAIRSAKSGKIEEGCVGAGTGMMSYDFKAGIGTSSRKLPKADGGYTIGVLVNANHGRRHSLRINGMPMGEKFTDLMPTKTQDGSIVVVIATDAPLDARQLSRLAKRAMLGLARTGAIAQHGSGDIAIAFSTANRIPHYPKKPILNLKILSDFRLDPLFEAAGDAAEEAVLNSMFTAKTVVGRDGNTAYAIPLDWVRKKLQE